jgi:hypothetical protein
MVLYINFTGFKKFQILAQNPKMLAFGFIEKRQFVTTTDQNSVFHGHKAHIPCRLHIIVRFINFYGFNFFQISVQN